MHPLLLLLLSSVWKLLRRCPWPLLFFTVVGLVEIGVAVVLVRKGFLGYVQVEKDKSWWTLLSPYAAPIAGLFGGLIALGTYFKSHNQKQEHYDRTALDAQFTDILDRFASSDLIMKASAANRLAEMATRRQPGTPDVFPPESYPYFPRAASQLATALHLEDNTAVRAEMVQALEAMTQFAEQHRPEQVLLHLLIGELADANRSAKAAFVQTLAECHASPNSFMKELAGDVTRLIQIAPLCDDAKTTTICVQSLKELKEFEAAVIVQKAIRDAQTPEACDAADRLLPSQLRAHAARLIDARNARQLAL